MPASCGPDSPADRACFHCGLPVPAHGAWTVSVDGAPRPMCCPGCQAVARAIVDSGLGDFYKHRTGTLPTAAQAVPEFLRQARVYDSPEVQKSFVSREDEHIREASLILEGIVCAACVWLNERHIAALPGVLEVSINYATHRARVRWDERRILLSDILQAIARIGYRAHPYDPARQQQLLEAERKGHLKRLGVAAVLGMQVMILAVALYAGESFGMEPGFRRFFHWLSLGLTLPVLLYAARPFFQAAWRDLRRRQVGMDVPVSLGIGLAFTASAWATFSDRGQVYFDSVVMFVFFLLSARYFEMAARKRAAEGAESLVRLQPAMATRLEEGVERLVPAAELKPGDRVRVLPGETVPADGVVLEGTSSVDESLLTGESLPLRKTAGERLVGGSINRESPLVLEVEKTGRDTVLAGLLRLLDRAQGEKPRLARLADRIAGHFVLGVLLLAAGVAAYWGWQEPARWLGITVAVLVVTCPCALSLATPAAMTAATGRLTRLGLLPTRGHALETLARAGHFLLDKTGTLTEGRLRLLATEALGEPGEDECLQRAAALESHSEHPIARALLEAAGPVRPLAAEVVNTPGAGLRGRIDGVPHFLGTADYLHEQTGLSLPAGRLAAHARRGRTVVALATRQRVLALFALGDRLRPDAPELVSALETAGLRVALLTGDQEAAARHVARAAGIREVHWAMKPQDKLDYVKRLQEQGAVVAMAGDGINDAPVLGAAHVSIAMGNGTQLAAASADMVLLSQELKQLVDGVHTARKTLRIIRQNLAWAVLYNLTALPLAALGLVTPWMAALGMSGSSLLVVANALRLNRLPRPRPVD